MSWSSFSLTQTNTCNVFEADIQFFYVLESENQLHLFLIDEFISIKNIRKWSNDKRTENSKQYDGKKTTIETP